MVKDRGPGRRSFVWVRGLPEPLVGSRSEGAVVDAELLRDLRRNRGLYANPWTHYPRLITSIDWLKRDRPMRLLRDVLPPQATYPRAFDLLVVDEVHTARTVRVPAQILGGCRPTRRHRSAPDVTALVEQMLKLTRGTQNSTT